MGSIFSFYQRPRVSETQPVCLGCFHPFFFAFTNPVPTPAHASTAYAHPGHRAQQDQAPGISEMATEQEIPSARCPRTGGPDESRGRADGTLTTCVPAPQHVLPLLGTSRAATRSLYAAPAAVTGESGKTVSGGSCSSGM